MGMRVRLWVVMVLVLICAASVAWATTLLRNNKVSAQEETTNASTPVREVYSWSNDDAYIPSIRIIDIWDGVKWHRCFQSYTGDVTCPNTPS